MNRALLLDTHVALWLESGDPRLRSTTHAAIDECWRSGGTIYLSAVSAWEIAMAVDKGRLTLDLPMAEWIALFLNNRPGLEPIALNHAMAIRAYELHAFGHNDPADRMLVASAIELRCPLVTYDDQIRRFARSRGREHGFSVIR